MRPLALLFILLAAPSGQLRADPIPPPENLRIFPVEGGCSVFTVSGTLQPGDAQYVHDIYARETGEKLGTVRMRWAHKYGSRYGGCGYAGEGVGAEWGGDGFVKVCLPEAKASVREIVVVPRLAKIADP